MLDSSDAGASGLPGSGIPVSVIMERRRIQDSPWVTESWQALGVTVGHMAVPAPGRQSGPQSDPPAGREPGERGEREAGAGPLGPLLLVQGSAAAQYLWTGLRVDFFPDEAESYYHNLMVAAPGCYIVARPGPDGMLRPVLVTVSFDAAQAYLEGGETVYSVPLPPELYRAAEAFVLANYVPEQRRKRERQDWKGDARGGH